METIFRDSANNDLTVYNNIEDAHGSSIQSAAWDLHALICNGHNYVKDMDDLLELSKEIAKACDKLKAACKGKKVEVYKLVK